MMLKIISFIIASFPRHKPYTLDSQSILLRVIHKCQLMLKSDWHFHTCSQGNFELNYEDCLFHPEVWWG